MIDPAAATFERVAAEYDSAAVMAAGSVARQIEVGKVLERHFRPVRLNHQLLGQAVPHRHPHVVPRYADTCARLAVSMA